MFSASHFYRQEKFSDVENAEIFGACFSPHGHGHNYVLEVVLEGTLPDGYRPMIIRQSLEQILIEVTRTLDHKHLNFEVQEFRTLVPTTENIVLYLRERVLRQIEELIAQKALDRSVVFKGLKLFETPDLWVEVLG